MSLEDLKKENLGIIAEIKETNKKISKLSSQIAGAMICQKLMYKKQRELVRDLYIAEGKMIILPPKEAKKKYQKTQKSDVEQNIKNLPEAQQKEMLTRLLAIRAARQAKNTDQK